MNAISTAAKARGATGFLHQPHRWEVTVAIPGITTPETYSTVRKRSAMRMQARRMKDAAHPVGRYHGATVCLWCDGKEITDYQPAATTTAP